MIVCLCRGKSDSDIQRLIDAGSTSLRELQRCGVGDQCGSCHVSLRSMLYAAAARETEAACPACPEPVLVGAAASA